MKKIDLNEVKKFRVEELEQRLEMAMYSDAVMGKPSKKKK